MKNKITEENLEEFIMLEYNKSKNYSKTFETIYKKVCNIEDKYDSLNSNFSSLFLYSIIKQKPSIMEYEKVIDVIYKTIDNQYLGFMFSRFFTNSTNISVKGYRKAKEMGIVGAYNEDYYYNQWDELAHTFFEHKEGEKLKLLPENKMYLFSLLKKLDINNYNCLYESHFSFIPHFLENSLEDLKEIIINQPLVIDKFVSVLSNYAYDMDLNTQKEFLKIYHDSVDNFEEIFYSHVLKKVNNNNNYNSSKKIECNMGLCCFAEAIGYNDFFHKINERLLNFMDDEDFKKNNTRFKDLLDNIIISLYIAFEDKKIDFDTNLINTKIPLLGNALYLIIIETQINQGNLISFSKDIVTYLEKEINIALSEKESNLNYFYNNSFNFPLLKNYLNYSNMENLIPQKNIVKPKKKI